MAVDLARLSLWLATLAREHEFTFLDHALKAGDSLVGLTSGRSRRLHWDRSKPGLPLFRTLVKERIETRRCDGREAIRTAPDDVTRADPGARHRPRRDRGRARARSRATRWSPRSSAADKPKARETARQEVESWVAGQLQPALGPASSARARAFRAEQRLAAVPLAARVPRVSSRATIRASTRSSATRPLPARTRSRRARDHYLHWLQTLHEGAHGNADLVAHFFRRAFGLLARRRLRADRHQHDRPGRHAGDRARGDP